MTNHLLSLVLASALAWPEAALAAPEGERARVAVLPMAFVGSVEAHTRLELSDRLLAGLVRGQFEVATVDSVEAGGCASAECRTELADRLAAEYVLASAVIAGDRSYRVAVELVDGATGSVLAVSARECEVCSVDEVGELVADVTTELRTKLDALTVGPPILAIDSDPAGARVLLDGQEIGVTPAERVVTAGEHEARLDKPGFAPQRLELRAVPGMRQAVSIDLQPLSDEVASGRRDLRPAGWTAVALGLASIAAGAALLAIDGRPYTQRCSGRDVDAEGDCRYRYDSTPGGAALVGVGGAGLVTGIALLVTHARRNASHRRGRRAEAAGG